MVRRSPGLVILLLGCAASVASVARAAPPPPRVTAQLTYTLGPGVRCPGETILHAEVARHLGYDPFTTHAKRRIVAAVQRRGHQLIAELAGFDEAGEPAWTKPPARYPEDACLALLSGMGNAIAFHLDPLIFPPSPPEPPKPKAPAPPDDHEPPNPMEPLLQPPPPDTPKPNVPAPKPFEIGLGPQLAIGAAGPAFSLLGHVGLRVSGVSVGIDIRYDAPSSAQADGAGEGVRLQAFSIGGALAPCIHVSFFLGCALLSGGAIAVSERGVDLPRPEIRAYLGTGPRVGVEKRFLPWLGVRLTGEALVMLHTFRGTIDGVPVRAPSPLSSRVNGATGASLLAYF